MMSMFIFLIGVMLIINFILKNFLIVYMQNMFFFLGFMYMYMYMNLKSYNYWVLIFMDYGLDKMSFLLLLLSIWVVSLMFLSVINFVKYYVDLMLYQMVMLMVGLMYFFFSLDLISFYLFFEMSLLPVLMMVLGWGVQPERIQAGIYMILYTLLASLPFFMILIYMNFNLYSLSFLYLLNNSIIMNNSFIYYFMVFVFLVKLPIYGVHLWLPKAHVEAPVFGSMILAGIMLKLGGYGLIRILMIFYNLMLSLSYFLIIYSLIGSLILSILCLRQLDLKMLVAYSSVVHMGFMLSGVLMNFKLSIISGVMMMVAHGLCSSGLFCLLNLNYKRINSRNLVFNKGLGQFFSNMILWWFLFCVINMSAPPSLNLISEILLMIIMMKFSYLMFMMIFFISFFSGAYSIYLFSFVQHGLNLWYQSFNFNTIDEYMLLILHWLPLNLFILNLDIFM